MNVKTDPVSYNYSAVTSVRGKDAEKQATLLSFKPLELRRKSPYDTKRDSLVNKARQKLEQSPCYSDLKRQGSMSRKMTIMNSYLTTLAADENKENMNLLQRRGQLHKSAEHFQKNKSKRDFSENNGTILADTVSKALVTDFTPQRSSMRKSVGFGSRIFESKISQKDYNKLLQELDRLKELYKR